jgi:cation diffusion facilitator CzcD-associated flavoprotein CzcO
MQTVPNANPPEHHQTIIIGAGFSGIGLAIRLQQQQHEFLLLEAGEDVGGVWRDNKYPAAACDVPSRLYSFSFAQNTAWQRSFSTQPEILAYLKACIKQHQLSQHIRCKHKVTAASFNAITGYWQLQTVTGACYTARFLVTACGQLCHPATPSIKGFDQFKGAYFHSARWLQGHDFSGQHVGVIGTGASAIQFIPEVAKQAAAITVFQRTPPYVLPKRDRHISSWERLLMARVPAIQNLIRKLIYSKNEFRALYLGPLKAVLRLYTWRWRWFMHRHIKDPIKRQLLTPEYVIGCKRILISNNYYPTLNQNHINLEPHAIDEIKSDCIKTVNGAEYPLDTIIFATGFKTSEFLKGINITGLNGINLRETWQDGAFAYQGLVIQGFPDFLMCYGPNTNIGHNSMIHVLESQFNYICDYITKSKANNIRYLEIKPEVNNKYQSELHKRLDGTVWQQGGCQSWYQTKAGKNTNNWPGMTVSYRLKTKSVNLSDYEANY